MKKHFQLSEKTKLLTHMLPVRRSEDKEKAFKMKDAVDSDLSTAEGATHLSAQIMPKDLQPE